MASLIASYKSQELEIGKKYHPISRMVMRECRHSDDIGCEMQEELKNVNFSVIKDENFKKSLKNIARQVAILKKDELINVSVFEYEKHYYISMQTPKQHFVIKDLSEVKSSTYFIFLVFGMLLSSFILLFITIIKKLYPLKVLKDKVKNLGDENFDFSCCVNTKQDEISLLAQEFSQSAKKLKEIKEARNIFIRNIMHELKTPITKGKFLTELPKTAENELLMKKVFYRLESLINEFASIEEVLASKEISTKEYFLSDIVDNAMDLMLDTEHEIELNIVEVKIDVNFKLFSIAIKNLLDNAIKYSPNHTATVLSDGDEICVISEGEPLGHELEYYFEPFHKENQNESGFGLGLYITSHIIKAHNMNFTHKYQDKKNYFCIHPLI